MKTFQQETSKITHNVADKILGHFLFFDFLHKTLLIIDIQIVISISTRTGYKLQKKKTINQRYFNFYERSRFSPADKILKHSSIFVIYL